jgi:hypothetical protein
MSNRKRWELTLLCWSTEPIWRLLCSPREPGPPRDLIDVLGLGLLAPGLKEPDPMELEHSTEPAIGSVGRQYPGSQAGTVSVADVRKRAQAQVASLR